MSRWIGGGYQPSARPPEKKATTGTSGSWYRPQVEEDIANLPEKAGNWLTRPVPVPTPPERKTVLGSRALHAPVDILEKIANLQQKAEGAGRYAVHGALEEQQRFFPTSTLVAEGVKTGLRGRLPTKAEAVESLKAPFEVMAGERPAELPGEPLQQTLQRDFGMKTNPLGPGMTAKERIAALGAQAAIQGMNFGFNPEGALHLFPRTARAEQVAAGAGEEIARGVEAAKKLRAESTVAQQEAMAKAALRPTLQGLGLSREAAHEKAAQVMVGAQGVKTSLADQIRKYSDLAGFDPAFVERAIKDASSGKSRGIAASDQFKQFAEPSTLRHGIIPFRVKSPLSQEKVFPRAADPRNAAREIAKRLDQIAGISSKSGEAVAKQGTKASSLLATQQTLEQSIPGKALKTLTYIDRPAARLIAKAAAKGPALTQAETLRSIFENVGEAANMGEAVRRGERAFAQVDLPFGKKLTTPQWLNVPAVSAASAVGRGLKQTTALGTGFRLTEGIGRKLTTPGEAFRTGLEGKRAFGEIGKTGREYSQAIGWKQAGTAAALQDEYRHKLNEVLKEGKGTSEEELGLIRNYLDVGGRVKHPLPGDVVNAILPTPLWREKAVRVGAILDDMRKAEVAVGLPVGMVSEYFPHLLRPRGKKFIAEGHPGFVGFYGAGTSPGFAEGRSLQGNIEEINNYYAMKHPETFNLTDKKFMRDTTVEPLWMRSMSSANSIAAVKAYDEWLSIAGRRISGSRDLRPGEMMVVAPGSFRKIVRISNKEDATAAQVAMDAALSGHPIPNVGVALDPDVMERLEKFGPKEAHYYAVPADVHKDMGLFTKRLTEDLGELPSVYRNAMQAWKIETLLPFPAYHIRNFFGNWTNAWMIGMSPSDIAKYGTAQARILRSAETGKGLDIPETFGDRTQTRKEWLHEMSLNGATRGGFMTSASRSQGFRTIGQPRFHPGDIPSFIPPQLSAGVPIPTFRPGAGNYLERIAQSGHARLGRALAQNVENHSRGSIYLWSLDKGLQPPQAVANVVRANFNFNQLPKAVEAGRGAFPFLAWTFKEVPFALAQAVQNPGKVLLPARLGVAARSLAGNPPNDSDFVANADLWPLLLPSGTIKWINLSSYFPQQELTRFAPTPGGKLGETPLSRTMGGVREGVKSLLGPAERIGLGVGPQGKVSNAPPGEPVEMYGMPVRKEVRDAIYSISRATKEFNNIFFPSYPTSPQARVLKALTGVSAYTVDQERERANRLRANQDVLNREAFMSGLPNQRKGMQSARQEYMRRLLEDMQRMNAPNRYQP